MAKKIELEMTNGNYAKNIILFAIPVIVSSWLQLSFNLADYIVCKNFVGENAVGAIGDTGSLSALIVDLFIGFAVGVNVVISKAVGSKNKEKVERAIGTSTTLALICGLVLAIIGVFMSKIFLEWMNTPSELIDMSNSYMVIYFIGVPFLLLYNFGAACLRGMGDTTKPFIYLTIGGIINVVFNIIFVKYCGLGVSGLAIATVMSEAISSILTIISLYRNKKGFASLQLKYLKPHTEELVDIIKIGIPAGIQSAMFDIANVIIQTNINSFGTAIIAGDSAASRINNFTYCGMDGFAQAGIAFIAANYGAKNIDGIKKSFKWSIIFCLATDVLMSAIEIIFRKQLVELIVINDDAVKNGELNILVLMSTHSLMALVDILAAGERGLGDSLLPAVVSFIGICVLRIIYVFTFFKMEQFHSMFYLYLTYPISWLITSIANGICCAVLFKKKFKEIENEKAKATVSKEANEANTVNKQKIKRPPASNNA